MRTLVPALLAIATLQAAEPALLLEITGEGQARGDRLEFKDHGTLRGRSFAGVSGASASPWQGGWLAYALTVGEGDRGFWLERSLPPPQGAGNYTLRFDLMADAPACRGGGGLELLGEATDGNWVPLAGVRFGRDGLVCVAWPGRPTRLGEILPHRWYRIELELDAVAGTCRAAVTAAGAAPSPPLELPWPRGRELPVKRLKLSAAGPAATYYVDNLRLSFSPRP